MSEVMTPGSLPASNGTEFPQDITAELLEWLENGSLTLVDAARQPVTTERWVELPLAVQQRALADFHRVVRGSTKAAVIFLED
ncbi:MAG: hypothetical protein ACK47B_25250 [Armatimonadota bacterium]